MHNDDFLPVSTKAAKTSGPGRKEEVEEADSILAAFKESGKQKEGEFSSVEKPNGG